MHCIASQSLAKLLRRKLHLRNQFHLVSYNTIIRRQHGVQTNDNPGQTPLQWLQKESSNTAPRNTDHGHRSPATRLSIYHSERKLHRCTSRQQQRIHRPLHPHPLQQYNFAPTTATFNAATTSPPTQPLPQTHNLHPPLLPHPNPLISPPLPLHSPQRPHAQRPPPPRGNLRSRQHAPRNRQHQNPLRSPRQ